jgi:succinate dehydrogenase / fumarate reductase membrane anchor subunit
VTSRWGTPFWRIYDGALLVLALIHGVNGARTVITDLVPRGGVRLVLVAGLALLAAAWLVLGLFVIIVFDPEAATAVVPLP